MRVSDLDVDRRAREMTWGWLVNCVHESWPGVFRQLALPAIRLLSWWQGSEAKAACAILRTRHTAIPSILHNLTSTLALLSSFVLLFTIVLSSTAQVTIVGFVEPSFLQRRGPTAIKTVPAIDRQLAWNIFIFRPKTNTLPYIQLPLPLHQPIGHHTVRHHNDTLSARTSLEDPPSAFHLTVHSLPSTLKQLLSHAVGPSN